HLSELTGIDRRYYQRMRQEAPFLLDRNVNHWLTNTPSKQRIIRTLETSEQDGKSIPPVGFQNQGSNGVSGLDGATRLNGTQGTNGSEPVSGTTTLAKPLRSASV